MRDVSAPASSDNVAGRSENSQVMATWESPLNRFTSSDSILTVSLLKNMALQDFGWADGRG